MSKVMYVLLGQNSICLAVVRQFSGSCPAVVWQLSNSFATVVGQLSNSCSTVVRQMYSRLSGSCLAVFRQSWHFFNVNLIYYFQVSNGLTSLDSVNLQELPNLPEYIKRVWNNLFCDLKKVKFCENLIKIREFFVKCEKRNKRTTR